MKVTSEEREVTLELFEVFSKPLGSFGERWGTFGNTTCNFGLVTCNFELVKSNFRVLKSNSEGPATHSRCSRNLGSNVGFVWELSNYSTCNFALVNCNFLLVTCNFSLVKSNFRFSKSSSWRATKCLARRKVFQPQVNKGRGATSCWTSCPQNKTKTMLQYALFYKRELTSNEISTLSFLRRKQVRNLWRLFFL